MYVKIRNSAKAVLLHQDKLLVSKYDNVDEGIYYLLPGGGQEPGETLHQTIVRECLEETGCRVAPLHLLFLRECFLQKGIHRIEFMFACRLLEGPREASEYSHLDNEQIGVEWISVQDLQNQPLYPIELRTLLAQYSKGNIQPVYLGDLESSSV